MTRSPGPPLAVSIAVLVAGFVIAAVGGIGAAVVFVRHLPATVSGLPAVVHRTFEPGLYDVYQHSDPTTLTPADVRVVSPGGSSVPVLPPSRPGATVTLGADTYTAVAEFSANDSGDYVIAIGDEGGQRDVVVARADGDIYDVPTGWLVVLAVGGFVALIGLVLLLTGIIRRDRAAGPRQPIGVPTGPILVPAGWYPDPGGTAHWRWWDGAKWTDHTG